MKLDEAIKHCEEVYENKKSDAEEARLQRQDQYANECMKCALEHSQLAEWLWELRRRREGKWIPCSKRLPEDGERVLVTTAWKDVTIAKRVDPPLKDTAWITYESEDTGTIDEIIAWMPLPQPWRDKQGC